MSTDPITALLLDERRKLATKIELREPLLEQNQRQLAQIDKLLAERRQFARS